MKNILYLTVMIAAILCSTAATAEIESISREVNSLMTANGYSFQLYIGDEKYSYSIGTKAGVKSDEGNYVIIFIKESGTDCYQYLRVLKTMYRGLKRNYLDFSLIPVDSGSAFCTKAVQEKKYQKIFKA